MSTHEEMDGNYFQRQGSIIHLKKLRQQVTDEFGQILDGLVAKIEREEEEKRRRYLELIKLTVSGLLAELAEHIETTDRVSTSGRTSQASFPFRLPPPARTRTHQHTPARTRTAFMKQKRGLPHVQKKLWH